MPANDHVADDRISRWVREHAAAVRGYLLGMTRRPDLADDLVQEVFQRAWEARDRYRDEGHERAFLLRIADRLVIDYSRRVNWEVNLDHATWKDAEPLATKYSSLDELQRQETNEQLMIALNELTTAQRRILLLRYFSDLTFEEIAREFDCPLSTALSHCRRGLMALRKLLTAKQT